MNLLYVSWKNLLHKPWSTSLSLLLAALGAGLISLLLVLNHQLEQQFERNLAGVDLVIGAKGSPLQLILSSMYHVDAPTGNIPISDCKAFLNPKHPLIETAIPLSLGDSYRAYRIVGTTHDFLDLYEAELAEGSLWDFPLEVVAGAVAAEKLGLQLGDTFKSSHGLIEDDHLIHADAGSFKVVGILKPSGSVADQLLLTANASLWVVHEHSPAESPAEENDHDHEHSGEDADHDHHHHDASVPAYDQPLYTYEDKAITSILATFKGRNIQSLNMQRGINENTNMQAATPAIEINRLYSTMGAGERILRALALAIVFVSALSIFISLYASLNQRRYELALMRVMGASRSWLFALILLEGALLALVGCLIGILLSHAGMAAIGGWLEDAYRYTFSATEFLAQEAWLVLGAFVIGMLAALLPAWRAGQMDIHDTLAEGG